MRVDSRDPTRRPTAIAAGLLLGGDWLPWKPVSLRPSWWQRAFYIDGLRVWSSICIEQLQPWTWIEALAQRPSLILAQSNAWWADESNAAPGIQAASTRSWARLMGLPVVWAGNGLKMPRTSGVAVKHGATLAQIVKINKPIDAAQQVIRGNVGSEIERINSWSRAPHQPWNGKTRTSWALAKPARAQSFNIRRGKATSWTGVRQSRAHRQRGIAPQRTLDGAAVRG